MKILVFYRSFFMQIVDLLVCMTKMRLELKKGANLHSNEGVIFCLINLMRDVKSLARRQ
jgi:hypothetical protein